MSRFVWDGGGWLGWLEDRSDASWCDACKEYHGNYTVGRVEYIGPSLWLATVYNRDGVMTDQADIQGTERQAKEWVLAVVRLS